MRTSTTDFPDEVALAAVDRHIAQLAGDLNQAELRDWLAADECHRRAWQHIQSTNQQFGAALGPVARAALLSPAGEQRRHAVKVLGLLLFTGSLGGLGYQLPWRETLADIRTGTGERRSVTLPGGAQLEVNTASAVNLGPTPAGLQLRLLQGELLLNSHGSAVTVATAQGLLRPQGARFAAQQQHRRSQVDVLSGSVAVYPAQAQGPAGVVRAGQSAYFDDHQLYAVRPTDEQRLAWTQGMLLASSMPLAQFVQTLARYRTGYLGCDPAIAHLRISGSYPLADTDRILASLTQSLPVRLRSVSPYWVRLVPASTG